jgi:hypothetical protein
MMRFIATALVLILFAWYLSFSASRLDRLHHRVETSWEHLDALLQRRAALALEISHYADLDPATALILTQSAYVSREESITERNDAERSLSESLKFLRESAANDEVQISVPLLDELSVLTEKITLAVAIHLEAVNSVAKLRAKFIYRIFHLAGKAKLPKIYSFEEDAL